MPRAVNPASAHARNSSTPSYTTKWRTFGDAFATFERLQRVVNSCERVYHRAHKELETARAHGLRR